MFTSKRCDYIKRNTTSVPEVTEVVTSFRVTWVVRWKVVGDRGWGVGRFRGNRCVSTTCHT